MKRALFLTLVLISFQSLAIFGSSETAQKDQKNLLESERNTISVFQNVSKAVVNISVTNKAIVRGFFTYDVMEVPEGMGTGFVWNDEGYLVTNFHVIQSAWRKRGKVTVTFKDDPKTYRAKIVGVEPAKDLAVLKLIKKPRKLTSVEKGISKELLVGQKAMAIGNPFGLDHTITSGIISALGRKVDGIGGVKIHGMIQADASINPGNSGGPLLNSLGEVIGVNTMIYSESGSSAGVGFAVPIDTVKRIVPDIIKFGRFQQPGIGISPFDPRRGPDIEKGLAIQEVTIGGPADKAGLKGARIWRDRYKLGDVITHVDGKLVNSLSDIINILYDYQIGDTVEITYLRGKKEKKAKLKLANLTKVYDQ